MNLRVTFSGEVKYFRYEAEAKASLNRARFPLRGKAHICAKLSRRE